MGFPGTSNFVGEFLILTGLFADNILISFLAATSIIWAAIYSIWLSNRIIFGTLKTIYIKNFTDLNGTELIILSTLAIAMIILGVNSSCITQLSEQTIMTIITR